MDKSKTLLTNSPGLTPLITAIPLPSERFDITTERFPSDVRFNIEKKVPEDVWVLVYRGDKIHADGTPVGLEVVNIQKIVDDFTKMVVITKPNTRFITITSFNERQRDPRREFGPRFTGWDLPISFRKFRLKLGQPDGVF